MNSKGTLNLREYSIFRWAAGALLMGITFAGFEWLNDRFHWVIIYLLLSIAAILFALLVSKPKRQFRAVILAILVVLTMWAGQLLTVLFDASKFLESSFARFLGLGTTGAWNLAMALGAISSILLVGSSLAVGSIFAAKYMLLLDPESGKSHWKTAIALLSNAMNESPKLGTIEEAKYKPADNKITATMPSGPGLINISSGHALVFGRPDEIIHIAGSDKPAYLGPLERGKHIVLLGPRKVAVSGDGLLTKDGIPLTLGGILVVSVETVTSLRKRLKKHTLPESRWYSPFSDLRDQHQIIKGEADVHHKESIYRSVCLPPGPSLDEALKDAAMANLRDAIARRPFAHIIDSSQTVAAQSSIHAIAEEVRSKLVDQTACWGIELNQFCIDRLDLSPTAQEEILQRWKQIPRVPATKEEADAQENFLKVLKTYEESGSFGTEASDFLALFQTTSRIIGIVRRAIGPTGMKTLNSGLQQLIPQIDRDDNRARKLLDVLQNLRL